MITLTRPSYYDAPRYAEYCGLSTDVKATIDAVNADKFYEIDTGKTYIYNGASGEWVEQPDTTAAVDTGIPPITTETAGHFLANDGSVTHWQALASEDFIITLTEATPPDGTYTADKTYVEIKAAFDAKENIAVSIGNGDVRLPLMNAQIAESGDAGFTFGYTQVTTNGQLVHTRAVNYFHTADPVNDEWSDVDQAAEYLQTTGGTMDGNLSMAANSITDVQEISTADQYPLYIGNIVHTAGTNGVRITSTTNNEAAVLAPDSQSTYRPINVGTPTAPNHAVNLAYLTQEVKDETATKKMVRQGKNTGAITTLPNGVYMLTACDAVHSGLAIAYICGSTVNIANVSELKEWTLAKGAVDNSIYINNTSATTDLDVYIVALGAGSAI